MILDISFENWIESNRDVLSRFYTGLSMIKRVRDVGDRSICGPYVNKQLRQVNGQFRLARASGSQIDTAVREIEEGEILANY